MRAIILAAGMGTRLRPLTEARPKALVPVGDSSFFERQLYCLRQRGIEDILVITGYRADAFSAWEGRGLSFIHNPRYAELNNGYSMLLAGSWLSDVLVLDGDVWLERNVIPLSRPATSRWYVGWQEAASQEWMVDCDQDSRVVDIRVDSGSGWCLSGLSYWTEADGTFLQARLRSLLATDGGGQLYWDEAPRRSLAELDIRAERLPAGSLVEVDNLAEHQALEARLGYPG